ncbi:MAG: hypothetical protein V3T16_01335 [Gemmatimonadales bacterium]
MPTSRYEMRVMINRREVAVKIGLVLFSTALALGALEGVFRVGLFSESLQIERLRYPWRFADADFDDDYWKLAFLFGTGQRAQRVGVYHPLFGWAPAVTPENPLGLISAVPYRVEDLARPILFYGNSFVGGATPAADRLPQVLDRLLPAYSVLNYGVGGYGVGQIHLRLMNTVGQFDHPIGIVGILTADLDRTILGFRSGQKPVYRLHGDSLALENLPILPNTLTYIEEHPPAVKSYLGRFLLFRARGILPQRMFNRIRGYTKKQELKLVVNARIMRAMRDEMRGLGLPLYGVIFYGLSEFEDESWRASFLRETFAELGITVFDTKEFLLTHMAETGESLDDLYYQDNGHPNVRGNAVLAAGIRDWLKAEWL